MFPEKYYSFNNTGCKNNPLSASLLSSEYFSSASEIMRT